MCRLQAARKSESADLIEIRVAKQGILDQV
jgi:hypothetical protein